ncbi:MAG: cell division protein FtsA [Pseudomonadota bacterium]
MTPKFKRRAADFYGPSPLPERKSVTVCVLDVGTAKTSCVIARLRPLEAPLASHARSHAVEVKGFGHYRSQGLKSGYVIDLDPVEYGIRQSVHQAEKMAGVTVETVIVSLTCGRIASDTLSATVALDGHAVSERDIVKVLKVGRDHAIEPGRSILHAMPIGFALDGDRGITDPRGMFGAELGVDMHVVTADVGPLRNLEKAINAAHLDVEGYVPSAHASGLAVLSDDEMDLGAVVLDMGAGTTSIGAFYDGEFVHADAIPVGGHHVTMDLARGLSTRVEEAERIKNLHGSALPSPSDDHDLLTIPSASSDGQDASHQVLRGAITRIIRPRVEETLEMVRDRLVDSGLLGLAAKRMVLTGGASQMTGVMELTRRMISRELRFAKPTGVDGLPEAGTGPAFAAVAGLLVYPQSVRMLPRDALLSSGPAMLATGTGGYIQRVSEWLRSSL